MSSSLFPADVPLLSGDADVLSFTLVATSAVQVDVDVASAASTG